METSTKKPWQSKTVLFGAITAILGAVAVFVPGAKPISDFISAHASEIGMGWGVLAIILRAVTKDAIVLTD